MPSEHVWLDKSVVCLVSQLLILLTQNHLEVVMSSTWSKAMETLLSGRIREGFLCFLRAARGMDWMRPGEIGCQVGTSIHPGLCHLSLLSALELNWRACLFFLNSQSFAGHWLFAQGSFQQGFVGTWHCPVPGSLPSTGQGLSPSAALPSELQRAQSWALPAGVPGRGNWDKRERIHKGIHLLSHTCYRCPDIVFMVCTLSIYWLWWQHTQGVGYFYLLQSGAILVDILCFPSTCCYIELFKKIQLPKMDWEGF